MRPLSDDGEEPARRLDVGDPLGDSLGERERRPGTVDRFDPGRYVVGLDRPSGGNGLADQDFALDNERTFLGTRTAAPKKAPQSLNLWVRIAKFATDQSDAFATSTRRPNAAGSETASSARILRSTSMPAAQSPAMNRL